MAPSPDEVDRAAPPSNELVDVVAALGFVSSRAACTFVAMSASLNWIAWNSAIG